MVWFWIVCLLFIVCFGLLLFCVVCCFLYCLSLYCWFVVCALWFVCVACLLRCLHWFLIVIVLVCVYLLSWLCMLFGFRLYVDLFWLLWFGCLLLVVLVIARCSCVVFVFTFVNCVDCCFVCYLFVVGLGLFDLLLILDFVCYFFGWCVVLIVAMLVMFVFSFVVHKLYLVLVVV